MDHEQEIAALIKRAEMAETQREFYRRILVEIASEKIAPYWAINRAREAVMASGGDIDRYAEASSPPRFYSRPTPEMVIKLKRQLDSLRDSLQTLEVHGPPLYDAGPALPEDDQTAAGWYSLCLVRVSDNVRRFAREALKRAGEL